MDDSKMRIFNYKRSTFWIIASIISGCLGFICFIGQWQIAVEQCGYDKVYDTEWHDTLYFSYPVFFIFAFILGIIGIVKIIVQIIKNWKAKIIPGILEFLILVFVAFALLFATLVTNDQYRFRRAVLCNMLRKTIEVGNSIKQYSKKYNHMPEANYWCDSLIEADIGISKHDFHIGQLLHIESNFAFNKNLDQLPIDGLADNTVLLFEANGYLNLAGGLELINQERPKDQYILLIGKRIYVYIYFIDGTIAKYRLHDGAVALYKPDKDEFTDYHKKGETPYSPLKWE